MNIEYSKTSVKSISQMDKALKQRIKIGIEGLTLNPPKGDFKPLQGFDNIYRLRIGKYRVKYKYIGNTLFILDIGSRGDIYK